MKWISGLSLLLAACTHAPRAVTPTAAPPPARGAASYAETVAGQNQRLIDLGLGAYASGDFARAVNHLEAALLLDAQTPQTWAKYILYYCYLATGDTRRALTVAASLVKERPSDPLAYQQVAVAQLWLNRPREAVDNLLRAREFTARRPEVNFYLGLAYEALGDAKARDRAFTEAVGEYEQILRVNPADFEANYELARLLLHWNRSPERAAALIQSAKQGLERRSQEIGGQLGMERALYVHYYLPRIEGILLHRSGDLANSQKALFDALANAPGGASADLAETYLYVGKNYGRLGESGNAIAFLERALSLDPDGPHAPEIRRELKGLISRRSTGS